MHQASEIQTSVWADQDHSIEEIQLTLESARTVSKSINDLIVHLFSQGELTKTSGAAQVHSLRPQFPNMLFHLIDVDHENALAFKVLEYDSRTHMHDFKNYQGLIIGEWADQLSRDAIASAYTDPHRSGLPRFSMVTKTRDDVRRYSHLIWPLRKKGKIIQLLVAARYHDIIIPSGVFERGTQVGPDEIGFPFIRRGGEIFRSVKTKFRTGMAIYPERKPISMQVRQIMGDNEINALVY